MRGLQPYARHVHLSLRKKALFSRMQYAIFSRMQDALSTKTPGK